MIIMFNEPFVALLSNLLEGNFLPHIRFYLILVNVKDAIQITQRKVALLFAKPQGKTISRTSRSHIDLGKKNILTFSKNYCPISFFQTLQH